MNNIKQLSALPDRLEGSGLNVYCIWTLMYFSVSIWEMTSIGKEEKSEANS